MSSSSQAALKVHSLAWRRLVGYPKQILTNRGEVGLCSRTLHRLRGFLAEVIQINDIVVVT